MRYLTLGEVVSLHRAVVAATGGAEGIRDLGAPVNLWPNGLLVTRSHVCGGANTPPLSCERRAGSFEGVDTPSPRRLRGCYAAFDSGSKR